jgi:isopenicillin-N N-acyltransferase like protein
VADEFPFPRIRVSGEPRDRGRAYGEGAAARIARSIEAYREVFAEYAGWDWARVLEEAKRYEKPVSAFSSDYTDELHGIADGAGVDFVDILAINVRTEVMFAAKARKALEGRPPPLECSSFAVVPEASADGHTLLGQNWDWLLHSFETLVVVEAVQEHAPDYVTVVEAGLLAKTGLNSAGIGLVTNALVTEADVGDPGIPYHVMLRAILDAETITDAHATLQRGVRSSSANYLIADRGGIAVNVEAAPGDFSRLFLIFPEDGVILHANHFQTDPLPFQDLSIWAMPDSPFRLERLRSSIRAAGGKFSLEQLKGFLADHAAYPDSVCCHPDRRQPRLEQFATVSSILIDLDARRLWVTDGPPCVSEYHALDCAGFLSKPSLRDSSHSDGGIPV